MLIAPSAVFLFLSACLRLLQKKLNARAHFGLLHLLVTVTGVNLLL